MKICILHIGINDVNRKSIHKTSPERFINLLDPFLIKSSWSTINCLEDDLPKEVVWRRKEGMSDGVGGLEKPWYSFIQDLAEKCITDEQLAEYKLLKPYTKEAVYYYQIFKEKFSHVPIKYHWMPKWSQTDDPSGRVLEIFNN